MNFPSRLRSLEIAVYHSDVAKHAPWLGELSISNLTILVGASVFL